MSEVYLKTLSKLSKRISVSKSYWDYIVNIKHKNVKGLEREVINALKNPVEIRRSTKDPSVYLYYGKYGDKFICVVAKHLNEDGFIITVYLTRRFVGEVVWRS